MMPKVPKRCRSLVRCLQLVILCYYFARILQYFANFYLFGNYDLTIGRSWPWMIDFSDQWDVYKWWHHHSYHWIKSKIAQWLWWRLWGKPNLCEQKSGKHPKHNLDDHIFRIFVAIYDLSLVSMVGVSSGVWGMGTTKSGWMGTIQEYAGYKHGFP